jgi:putative transposase
MKNRDYKIFIPNGYYHIYNRGSDKQVIFVDETDYLNFLKRLKLVLGLASSSTLNIKPLPPHSFSFLSYCLMPNHFHFLIRQNTNVGIPNLISKLCTSYCMYFNKRHKRVGPLFQDTFKAKMVDSDQYLSYLSAYIHNNPAEPLQHAYSSLPDILGLRNGTIADKNTLLGWFNNNASDYRKFIESFNQSNKQIIS